MHCWTHSPVMGAEGNGHQTAVHAQTEAAGLDSHSARLRELLQRSSECCATEEISS